jgi:hypothetical protein
VAKGDRSFLKVMGAIRATALQRGSHCLDLAGLRGAAIQAEQAANSTHYCSGPMK